MDALPATAGPAGPAPGRRSGAVLVLALLVLLQGAGLLGFAVFYLVEIIAGRSGALGRAWFGFALIAAGGVALVLVARGLVRARRWSRTPALLTQIFIVPVAVGLMQGGLWYAGVPLLLWAAAVAILLLRPSTAESFRD
jgi:hypothetical protein